MSPPENVNTKPFPKNSSRSSSWDKTRARELKLIHIAKAHFNLTRDDYEFVIQKATGTKKTSAADLTHLERNALLKHFKALGFVVRAPGAEQPLNDPQSRKLRAMWYALSEAGAVERPETAVACDNAVEAWGKRQLGNGQLGSFDALRFASGEQLAKLVEEMKRWGRRVGADID